MLFSYLFGMSLLGSVTTVAMANPQAAAVLFPKDGIYRWKVNNWEAKYQGYVNFNRTGATYSFDIEGEDFGPLPDIPSFSASCTGADEGGDYTPCRLLDHKDPSPAANIRRTLSAKLLPVFKDEENLNFARIQVSYEFVDSVDERYNYTCAPFKTKFFSRVIETFNLDNITGHTVYSK